MPRKNIEVQTNCSKKFCDDNAVDRSYRPIQAYIEVFHQRSVSNAELYEQRYIISASAQ